MFIPGKIETWILIQDAKDVGITQIPVGLLKTLCERLSVYYTSRLETFFTINVPLTINALWSVVKLFLEPDTRKKVIIEKKKWEKLLTSAIPANTLEQKYGGTLPNKENFYPFTSN
jgi:CRAL/TRIO domain